MSAPYKKQGRGGGGRGGGGGHGGRGGGGRGGPGRGGGGRGGGNPNHNKGGGGRGGGNPNDSKQTQDILTTMLTLLFEKNQDTIYVNGVLQLSNFKQCPDLNAVSKSIDFNTKGFCNSLCSVIRQTVVSPQFIAVDNNEIKTMHYFLEAIKQHDMHVGLQGLSAVNNQISDLNFVPKLKQFENLKELKFVGNAIQNRSDYFNIIRKTLPNLLGLDGNAVVRAPLSLPWPVPTQRTDELTQLLVHIDTNLFQRIASGGVDNALPIYHQQAIFTLTTDRWHIVSKCDNNNKQVTKDLSYFKSKMENQDRNLVASSHITRCAIGRSKVGAMLIDALYPKNVDVLHDLDANAEVSPLQAGPAVKMNMVLCTIHGTMKWKHHQQDANDKHINACTFDRTFTLINENGDWLITNDACHLRKFKGDAILVPSSRTRVEKISRRYNLPTNIVSQVIAMSSNDATMVEILNDLQLPVPVLEECSRVCNADASGTILVARMVSNMSLRPDVAFEALKESEGNLENAVNIAKNKYNDQKFKIQIQ